MTRSKDDSAGTGRWKRFYVPEIHDIHSGMESGLPSLLDTFPVAARAACALLVVPNWGGRAPLEADRDLAGALRSHPGPKVLHGWTHSLGRDWLNWLVYGHENRSEFAALELEEASRRLHLAGQTFRECLGASPRWFCAPRWQENGATRAALFHEGIAGSMRKNELVIDGRETVPLPALGFDEGDRWVVREINYPLRQRRIDRIVEAGEPFRLAIHPSDRRFQKTWRQLTDLVKRLTIEGWEAISLDQAVDRWRGAAA